MERRKWRLAAGSALLFAAGAGTGASLSQALDPAIVAPHIYAVKFENDRVRVLETTLRNGEMPPLHQHPDRLVVYLSSCAWLEVTGDGKRRMQSFGIGDIAWEPGMMHGGEPSDVVHDCRQLDIEFKKTGGGP